MDNNEALTIITPGGLQIAPKFTSTNIMVVALQGTRIRECTNLEVMQALAPAIEKARFDLGMRADSITKEDNKIFMAAVLLDLRTHFYMLTLNEMVLAIYKFVRGEYQAEAKQQVFLTVANLAQAFAKLMTSQSRTEAKAELLALQSGQEVKQKPTPEQIEAKRLELIQNAYNAYRDKLKFDDIGNYVYDAIEQYKPIPFSDERKKQIAAQAKRELHIIHSNAVGRNSEERKKNKQLAALFAPDAAPTQEAKDLIRTYAKKLALLEFFKDLAEVDEDILLVIKTPVDEA